MTSRPCRLLLAAALCIGVTLPASAVPLPTYTFVKDPDRSWKEGLRDWILLNLNNNPDNNVNAANFALPRDILGELEPIGWTWDMFSGPGPSIPGYCTAAEEERIIEEAWLLEADTRPLVETLNIPEEAFTLDYIEGAWMGAWPHNINVADHIVQPFTYSAATAGYGFLYQWDHGSCMQPAGNPYYQDPGVLNRAIVVLAVDLILYDQMHKTISNDVTANYTAASEASNPSGFNGRYIDPSCWIQGIPGQPQPGARGYVPPGLPPGSCSTSLLKNEWNQRDYLALALEDMVTEYWFIRSSLPNSLTTHFDQAFIRLGNRLALWQPWGLQFNRIIPGANALYLIAYLTGDQQALHDYVDFTKRCYDPQNGAFDRGGFFPDDYAWDASYNRLNLMHVARLARLEAQLGATAMKPFIDQALDDMYTAKAYMTVVDPDGARGFQYAPSHFNTRTPGDIVWGQGQVVAAPFDAVSLGVDQAFPDLRGFDPTNLLMLKEGGSTNFRAPNNAADISSHIDPLIRQTTSVWYPHPGQPYTGVQPWTPYFYGYMPPAYSVALHNSSLFPGWALDRTTPEIELYPMERPGDGYKQIDNDFVWFKLGRMSALIHTGPVSHYEEGPNANPDVANLPAGFGGGMISYFAAENGGGMIQSRRRLRYAGNGVLTQTMDHWPEFDRWSLHNLWLENPQGGLTQSARILQPTVKVLTTGAGPVPTTVTINVNGVIPASNARFGTVLTNPVKYTRSFVASQNALQVTTQATTAGPVEMLKSLVETLPLNGLGYVHQGAFMQMQGRPWEDLTATFQLQSGGLPIDALANPDVWYSGVSSVIYGRLGGQIKVTFVPAARVKLAPAYHHWWSYDPLWADGQRPNPADPWSPLSMSAFKTRNLVVDLLGNAGSNQPAGLVTASVSYTITAL